MCFPIPARQLVGLPKPQEDQGSLNRKGFMPDRDQKGQGETEENADQEKVG